MSSDNGVREEIKSAHSKYPEEERYVYSMKPDLQSSASLKEILLSHDDDNLEETSNEYKFLISDLSSNTSSSRPKSIDGKVLLLQVIFSFEFLINDFGKCFIPARGHSYEN